MSYLIALYVRYHGNNLASYGILIGSVETEERNSGLKRPEEIDPTKVDPNLIEAVKRQQILENSQDSYEQILKAAILRSQKESYNLYKAGMVQNTIYENTPETLMSDYDNYGVDVGVGLVGSNNNLDFFDEMNRMGNYDQMALNNKPW